MNEPSQGAGTPIFDAIVDRGISDAVAEELAEAVPPPDAAARDAARRQEAGPVDDALHDDEFRFITRGVSDEERAAVIAVLSQVRAEQTKRAKRVERRELQPWARSQRVPEGIADLLADS
ncbi:hypothetical protein ACFPZL_05875 [Leucobacter soli]|uniref:Uncharacterized protein n=1 Tax=Leucobacter soli TaxID=2812850 RepID=A0A916JYB6_9MICO|nr:hypothetical protein [Leucobacter soli]CAG7607302.1 hypothetical protein LEUCIP111803_01009 [Leucobacter soli]